MCVGEKIEQEQPGPAALRAKKEEEEKKMSLVTVNRTVSLLAS